METADNTQESRRCQLLGVLFGSEVPPALEGQLLRTADVAALFQVSERTVSEWAKRGHIPSVRTPGGHRRYPADGVRAALEHGRDGRQRTTDAAPDPGPAPVTLLDGRRAGGA